MKARTGSNKNFSIRRGLAPRELAPVPMRRFDSVLVNAGSNPVRRALYGPIVQPGLE